MWGHLDGGCASNAIQARDRDISRGLGRRRGEPSDDRLISQSSFAARAGRFAESVVTEGASHAKGRADARSTSRRLRALSVRTESFARSEFARTKECWSGIRSNGTGYRSRSPREARVQDRDAARQFDEASIEPVSAELEVPLRRIERMFMPKSIVRILAGLCVASLAPIDAASAASLQEAAYALGPAGSVRRAKPTRHQYMKIKYRVTYTAFSPSASSISCSD
jgi:hypothetical protein